MPKVLRNFFFCLQISMIHIEDYEEQSQEDDKWQVLAQVNTKTAFEVSMKWIFHPILHAWFYISKCNREPDKTYLSWIDWSGHLKVNYHFFLCLGILCNYVSCIKVIVYFKSDFRPSKMDEFVYSSEQIWINLALHNLLTNGSSAVNGCQNESPNSW